MPQDIKLSDLPSGKFNYMKTCINYDRLQNFSKNITSYEDINLWVDEFITNIGLYLKKPHFNELITNDKGCHDFNYLIEQIIQKIISLFDNPGKHMPLTEKIKNLKDEFFSSNTDLTCKKNYIYVNHKLKPLYDFCEDEIFIKNNLSEIEKSDQCEQIISDMSIRKIDLKRHQTTLQRKISRTRIRDIPCDPTILDNTFPFFNCTPIKRPAPESGVDIESSSNFGGAESRERLINKSTFSFGDLPNRDQRSLTVRGKSDANNDSSSNAIGLVSLPIFGVLALSLFLYKHTPLKSKFHAYFQNKGDILLDNNYEETEQMLSNIPNLNDMDSESMQYNVSYQTL
ncbi:hypothetical protein, conserved [Plasmodium ovale]|uniref:PIR protein n=1 Tax=Plasmodium ovale TaxID=36330 RepID=A0A1C3KJX6_PLAOA|nr:hypothetical protein, conserved [Plasmodium ovale]